MLALGKRDRVVFRGLADGTVVLCQESGGQARRPRHRKISALSDEGYGRTSGRGSSDSLPSARARRSHVKGVEVDLGAALPDDGA
jgi:antitoxin PrlF